MCFDRMALTMSHLCVFVLKNVPAAAFKVPNPTASLQMSSQQYYCITFNIKKINHKKIKVVAVAEGLGLLDPLKVQRKYWVHPLSGGSC
ncbi:protein ALP1-like isoform X1, partial [Aphis craccivora]